MYYIGQTKKSVNERFKTHKEDPQDTMHKYDGNWTIKQIAKLHFFDQKVLLDVERLYTLKYQLEGGNDIEDKNGLWKI